MKKVLTMLSALTITSSTASLVIACGNKENKTSDKIKGESIDLSKINADMIINWKSEYMVENDKETKVTPDKLGTLKKNNIEYILGNNLKSIIDTTITGINKSKYNTRFIELFVSDDITASDSEILNFSILLMFEKYIKIDVKASNENNKDDKAFNIKITIKKWNEIEKDIEKSLNDEKEERNKEIPTLEEMIEEIKKHNMENVDASKIEKIAKNEIRLRQSYKKVDVTSIKSMYELIKGKSTTIIPVDLNPKT